MTVTISISSSTKPASSIFSFTFMLKSRRESPSSARMKMWPPSSTGIGIRFSSPRFRLIIAIRPKSCDPALLRGVARQLAIATGPISCLTEVSRVNRPPSVLHDQLRPLPVLLRRSA